MESLLSAAKLLERCDRASAAGAVTRSLGFGELLLLDPTNLDQLRLPDFLKSVHLARGRDALRALAFEANGELRLQIERVARRLWSTAPQFLWVIVGVDVTGDEVGIASFGPGNTRSRIAALITHRNSVVDSDAETLCALAAANSGSALLTHLRWLEILGRESVSRRFFMTLEQKVAQLARSLSPAPAPEDSSELALLCVSRLLFLSFLETKGWLDSDRGFLSNRYADCMLSGGSYHQRVLSPLFFGTLNTEPRNRALRAKAFGRVPFLNGGLFARSHLERVTSRSRFSDEAIGDVFGDLLCRYRFTAREDSASWSEAAVDPEMLGRSFEALMSHGMRKQTGAYYTPQSLVIELTRSALAGAMPAPSLEAIDSLRVLDPACGSGAFLVHALESLAHARVELNDMRPIHEIRRGILGSSIFGVDINPTAVWLCELRLWLSMAIENPEADPLRVPPLPNLDRNIRVGDSLSGDDFAETSRLRGHGYLRRLRLRYARATGQKKRALSLMLYRAERSFTAAALESKLQRIRVERREILETVRTRDLFGERPHPGSDVKRALELRRSELRNVTARLRRLKTGGALPFSFVSGFSEVAARGGFDIVIGNPPWIRIHNLDVASRAHLRRSFDVYRESAWRRGGELAGAGSGFASQIDAAALFIERSLKLLRPDGISALIVPAKLWRSLAGGGVRAFLTRESRVLELVDLGSSDRTFDAAVYPSIVVARRIDQRGRKEECPASNVFLAAHRDGRVRRWCAPRSELVMDQTVGAPWLLIPPDVRCAFDQLVSAGRPLASTRFGRPLLGVKTGCNDAFVVTMISGDDAPGAALVTNGETSGKVESALLRPVARGNRIERWRLSRGGERIVWTHDDRLAVLPGLPPLTRSWLSRWRRVLEKRTDARSSKHWWGVFRVEGTDSSVARVVWADIGKSPKAAVIPSGDLTVALNSCYVVRCADAGDAFALAAILNSSIAAAWLAVLAEPARGGYRRFLGWTMSLFPLPTDWRRARDLLSPIGERAFHGMMPAHHDLNAAVISVYGLEERSIAALLEWST